jgi:hypothetical protein
VYQCNGHKRYQETCVHGSRHKHAWTIEPLPHAEHSGPWTTDHLAVPAHSIRPRCSCQMNLAIALYQDIPGGLTVCQLCKVAATTCCQQARLPGHLKFSACKSLAVWPGLEETCWCAVLVSCMEHLTVPQGSAAQCIICISDTDGITMGPAKQTANCCWEPGTVSEHWVRYVHS